MVWELKINCFGYHQIGGSDYKNSVFESSINFWTPKINRMGPYTHSLTRKQNRRLETCGIGAKVEVTVRVLK